MCSISLAVLNTYFKMLLNTGYCNHKQCTSFLTLFDDQMPCAVPHTSLSTHYNEARRMRCVLVENGGDFDTSEEFKTKRNSFAPPIWNQHQPLLGPVTDIFRTESLRDTLQQKLPGIIRNTNTSRGK